MISPREKALLTLYDIEYKDKYSNMAIKDALSGMTERREKAFITQLVYGVVRRKLTLDYIISKYSSVKLKKLSKYVLLILRMGVFQIYFMDSVPERAAVNESVVLAKKYCAKSSGFVNGVLHSVIRGRDTLKYPSDETKYLSIKYSFTEEMVEIFRKYDFCEELLASLNKEPETVIRINRLKGQELEIDGVELNRTPLYEYARIAGGFDIENSREYQDGRFIAQDIAAMMAAEALAPKPGQLCIDVCAAPGGKTTHIAELMQNKGKVIAFDIHEHKTEIIKKNAKRMGIDIIETYLHDASVPEKSLFRKADRVLADVPCSGLGIIRRKPDIKWNKDDINELPLMQYRILENASEYVKDGGYLVYSTCTLNPEENENVIREFVKNNRDFEFEEIILPGNAARENDGCITFFPNIDNTDGFFISKIKRCGR